MIFLCTFAVEEVPVGPDPGDTEEISKPTSTPEKRPILCITRAGSGKISNIRCCVDEEMKWFITYSRKYIGLFGVASLLEF